MSGCSWAAHKVLVYHSDIDIDIVILLVIS